MADGDVQEIARIGFVGGEIREVDATADEVSTALNRDRTALVTFEKRGGDGQLFVKGENVAFVEQVILGSR